MAKRKVLNSRKQKQRILLLSILAILMFFIIIERIQEKTVSTAEPNIIIGTEDITDSLKDDIIIQNGGIYLSFDDVKKIFDNTLYIEPDTNLIITSSTRKVAILKIDNTSLEINGSIIDMQKSVFKTEEGKIYLPISELVKVYDIEFSYIEETKNITIDFYSKELKTAVVKNNSSVKNSKSIFSKTIANEYKGNKVVFIEEKDGWTKVRASNGMIGYIKSNNLESVINERENFEETNTFNENEALSRDITKSKIEKYENRKKVINDIISKTISAKKTMVKITYNGDKDNEAFNRFKIEAKPMLKECGINVKFE